MPDHPIIDRRRRRLLAVGVGGATAALAGLGALKVSGAGSWSGRRWAQDVIRAHLPDIEIDATSLEAFAHEAAQDLPALSRFSVQAETGWLRLAGWLGLRVATPEQLEQVERQLITRFLIGSNFFQLDDPRRARVVYASHPKACGNPFATFRDA
jgi:hypothetical protein